MLKFFLNGILCTFISLTAIADNNHHWNPETGEAQIKLMISNDQFQSCLIDLVLKMIDVPQNIIPFDNGFVYSRRFQTVEELKGNPILSVNLFYPPSENGSSKGFGKFHLALKSESGEWAMVFDDPGAPYAYTKVASQKLSLNARLAFYDFENAKREMYDADISLCLNELN